MADDTLPFPSSIDQAIPSADEVKAKVDDTAAKADRLVDRLAASAHSAVDALHAKAAPLVDKAQAKALLAAVPFPDLDRPLDFVALGASGASDKTRWNAAFRPGESETGLAPADLGNGHWVLASRNADVKELQP